MNLIEIADNLKSMPNGPQAMQALQAYANGANPSVPPYLALAELNRRTQMMKDAQAKAASQPPQGTVKDQVEKQAGILALQQGRQQQMMQDMMQNAGNTPAPPTPENIPQPQPQDQPPGGIAAALQAQQGSTPGMRRGGVVRFDDGGGVGTDPNSDQTRDPNDPNDPSNQQPDASNQTMQLVAQAVANGLTSKDIIPLLQKQQAATDAQIAAIRKQKENIAIPTEEDERIRRAKADPERYGYLLKPPGDGDMERFDALIAAKQAEVAKQRQENEQLKPGILQLLGRAAMNTRGQYGGSALASILGGYEKLQSDDDASSVQQERDLRLKEIGFQKDRNDMIVHLNDAKRAMDEGDIKNAVKAKMKAAEIAQKYDMEISGMLKTDMTATAGLLRGVRQAELAKEGKVATAQMKGAGAPKPGASIIQQANYLLPKVKEEFPNLSEAEQQDIALKRAQAMQPGSINTGARTVAEANKQLSSMQLRPQWRVYLASKGNDEAKAKADFINEYISDALPTYMREGKGPTNPAAAPAAAPAPAASDTTPKFTVTAGGKTYTFPTQEAADRFKAAAGVK